MFQVAGVSVNADGSVKVRWANDLTRVKVLTKTGSTAVELMELPEAMDKGAAVTFLKGTELYANPLYREAIDAADFKYNGVGEIQVIKATKPAKAVKAKPDMEQIRARAAEAKVTEPEAEVKKSVEAETV
jgi:hypothetical protein